MEVNPQVKSDAMKFATTLAEPALGSGACLANHGPYLNTEVRRKQRLTEKNVSNFSLSPCFSVSSVSLCLKKSPRWLRALALVVLCLLSPLRAAFADSDDPMEILRKARIEEAAQSLVLDGQVRHAETKIPFRLTLDQGEIKYEFFNPDQTLVLQLGDKAARLVEVTKSGAERVVTDAQYDKKVRGTDITYEDLAMRFLYWPVAKMAGQDIMLTRKCWKLRVEPGNPKTSQDGYVLLWIEKQSGALVQVETYDKAGNLIKRFEVKSVQKIGDGYILKQMRIQEMKDGEPVDPDPTYLEIQKPKDS